MIRENLTAFLQEQGANRTRHSGRTLYKHLVGTHDLLREWGCDEDVCVAGLYHSIYGTQRFRHSSWPLGHRDTIRSLIGRGSEYLVYLFCVINRPKVLVNGKQEDDGSLVTHDFHTKRNIWISRYTLKDLREIEAANLLEQKSYSPVPGKLLLEDIREAAKSAIRENRLEHA